MLRELGSMTSRLRTTLGESLPSLERFDVPIEQATTPSLTALKAYALGLEERRHGRELESIAFFNQAIDLDHEFASAYATLSTVYGSLGEWHRSEEFARLAYVLQKRVSERERLFITYQYHDRVTGNQDKAASTLELWKASYPRESRPANALALIYNRTGRYDRAEEEAQEALRRSPGHPFPLSNLAIAHRARGRYADAKQVGDEAVALGVETAPTRRLLYQVGLLLDDGTAATHLAWAKDRSREFDLVSAQAQVAVYHGRLREAGDLYRRAIDMAVARGLRGTASGYAAQLAWAEALYRERHRADDEVRRVLALVDADEGPGTLPRFRAAAALALAGVQTEAMALVTRAEQSYPEATFVRTVLGPATRAAAALRQQKPDAARAALEAAVQTEFGTVAGLVPPFLRGRGAARAGTVRRRGGGVSAAARPSRRGAVRADGGAGAARARPRAGRAGRCRGEPPRLRCPVHHVEDRGRGSGAARRGALRVRAAPPIDHAAVTTPARISHYEVARPDRARRADRDLSRARPAARARRRAQDPAARRRRPARRGRALPARGAHRLARHTSAHLHRPRLGRGERPRLSRAGTARRARARRDGRRRRGAAA